MSARCPVCLSEHNTFISLYPDANRTFLTVDSLRRCHDCGLVFAWPMPSASELDTYYGDGSYHTEHAPFSAEFFIFSYQLALSRIRLMLKWIDLKQNKRFLDIGAGNGVFGKALKEVVPDSCYEAVEPNADCRKGWGDWVLHSYCSLDEIQGQSYSVITLNQVLEHVNRPIDFLKKIAEYLALGGFLFVDVPHRDDLYKSSVEPHLLFWEKRSLEHAMQMAGLQPLYCDSVGMKWDQARRYFNQKKLRQRMLNPWAWVSGVNRMLQAFGIEKGFDTFQQFQADSYGGRKNWLRCLVRRAGE